MNADGRVRRKVGRWKQEEVDELISLTRVYGRGKWKAILEHSGNVFQHRNQARCPAKLAPTWEHGSRLRFNHWCVWGLLVSPSWWGPCRSHCRLHEQPHTAQGFKPCARSHAAARPAIQQASPANPPTLHSTSSPLPTHSRPSPAQNRQGAAGAPP